MLMLLSGKAARLGYYSKKYAMHVQVSTRPHKKIFIPFGSRFCQAGQRASVLPGTIPAIPANNRA